jgi:hypothetical protein
MRVASSSSDQWETGVPASAGWVVARTRTLWRSSGGKSGRAAAAGQVVQASQTLSQETLPPARYRGRVAVEFGSDLVVGGPVGLGTAENEARPKGQPLGTGTGADQLLKQLRLTQEQADAWSFTGHWQSLPQRNGGDTKGSRKGRTTAKIGQTIKCTQQFRLIHESCETLA